MITRPERKNRHWLRLLLILPFVVLLFPPFYNFQNPEFHRHPIFLLVPAPLDHHHSRYYSDRLFC